MGIQYPQLPTTNSIIGNELVALWQNGVLYTVPASLLTTTGSGLPALTSGAANEFLQVNSSGSAYQFQTANQVLQQLAGTTAGAGAPAGIIGQLLTSLGTATTLTSATAANLTTLSLTAGEWDVSATMLISPAGTTTTTARTVGISTTSATQPTALGSLMTLGSSLPAGVSETISSPTLRFGLTSTTIIYLVATVTFAISTMQATGFIRARRVC